MGDSQVEPRVSMRKLWPALITAACMVGCGSGDGTPLLQVKGVTAALTTTQTCSDGNVITLLGVTFSSAYDTAFLSNPANACVRRANNSSYAVFLWVLGANPAPFVSGSYEVHQDDAGGVAGFVTYLDGGCTQFFPNELARSGTLQLTTVSSSRIAGRVDLVFPDGVTAGDTFDAPVITTAANPCAMLGIGGGTGNAPGGDCASTVCQQ